MAYFDRNSRSGGRFGGNKNFSAKSGSAYGGKSGGKAFMHKATCAECGSACEVPFKPTGDRDVFCSNCFHKKNGEGSARLEGRSFNKPSFSAKGGFGDKLMFEAICDKCGNNCQVPFRPSGGKPVYCKACFNKDGNPNNSAPRSMGAGEGQYKAQFEMLNNKLDKILKALGGAAATVPATAVPEKKIKREEKVEKVEAEAAPLKPSKKTVKKLAAKKKK